MLSPLFLYQTGAVVYALPSSDAEVVVRLDKGAPVTLLQPQDETRTGWWAIQTASGQQGFLKATAKTITVEQLLTERDKIRHGYTLGRRNVVMGSGILLFGCVMTLALVFADRGQMSFVISYGAIGVGAGELLWGLEQIANVRRTLKEFDTLWHEALN